VTQETANIYYFTVGTKSKPFKIWGVIKHFICRLLWYRQQPQQSWWKPNYPRLGRC